MAKSKRVLILLVCTVCKSQNYTSSKNPDNIALKTKSQATKLSFQKYCKRCRKTTEHREIKI
ncbi:50S ribosomal protein L33 [Candidatus Curtissbacteria bacterium RIFCSPLOWO2_01_FULL_42_26]|uniref:Large ribosomal subunit protein bL33 n=1 Tax=Candidatus Curtissbacteria bacterium RIFCSPLOWO2_01_FULL_42_26 TaxID=1797729 RepID=A0A1F5I1E1_9BACT|nr:MAG: 50S ribosomal protein L33 [Candidatus Curtissbacteria bacterium RIFCSPLOWO2_01_FULL_42_26]